MQREYSDDRAWLTIKLDLDLRDLFTWNTKQVRCCLPVHALQGGVVFCALAGSLLLQAAHSASSLFLPVPACTSAPVCYAPQKQAGPS